MGQIPKLRTDWATAAAIDRVVHHSVILEFDVSSYRTAEATAPQAPSAARAGGSGRPGIETNTSGRND